MKGVFPGRPVYSQYREELMPTPAGHHSHGDPRELSAQGTFQHHRSPHDGHRSGRGHVATWPSCRSRRGGGRVLPREQRSAEHDPADRGCSGAHRSGYRSSRAAEALAPGRRAQRTGLRFVGSRSQGDRSRRHGGSLGWNSTRPLLTTFTVSANTPDKMAADARAYTGAKALKLKLTGQPIDADRVRAVRAVCSRGMDRGRRESGLHTSLSRSAAARAHRQSRSADRAAFPNRAGQRASRAAFPDPDRRR